MMMNQLSLLLCTVVASSLIEAAYLQSPNIVDAAKDNESVGQRNQPLSNNDIRAMYMERYSPEVVQMLLNPHLMQELHEAIQQQTLETEYKPTAPKRAQTFVRFGKRAQTFVRFG